MTFLLPVVSETSPQMGCDAPLTIGITPSITPIWEDVSPFLL